MAEKHRKIVTTSELVGFLKKMVSSSSVKSFIFNIFKAFDLLAARLLSSCYVSQGWKNQQAAHFWFHLFPSIMISFQKPRVLITTNEFTT